MGNDLPFKLLDCYDDIILNIVNFLSFSQYCHKHIMKQLYCLVLLGSYDVITAWYVSVTNNKHQSIFDTSNQIIVETRIHPSIQCAITTNIIRRNFWSSFCYACGRFPTGFSIYFVCKTSFCHTTGFVIDCSLPIKHCHKQITCILFTFSIEIVHRIIIILTW